MSSFLILLSSKIKVPFCPNGLQIWIVQPNIGCVYVLLFFGLGSLYKSTFKTQASRVSFMFCTCFFLSSNHQTNMASQLFPSEINQQKLSFLAVSCFVLASIRSQPTKSWCDCVCIIVRRVLLLSSDSGSAFLSLF